MRPSFVIWITSLSTLSSRLILNFWLRLKTTFFTTGKQFPIDSYIDSIYSWDPKVSDKDEDDAKGHH
jgi:hypothetical protein